jgi:hypothetical protein
MERFLANRIIAGIVEMPKCRMYWLMRQDLAQPPRNLINCMRKCFYINGNKTPKADDHSDYDP